MEELKKYSKIPTKEELEQHYKRNKELIEEKTKNTNADMCACEDAWAESFELNPTGHYVNCPCWGTNHPNKNWGKIL